MMNAEILGFSVIDSGPVGAVHLPYNPGITVLYGQNGAGKSYVLRAVVSALSGIRPASGRAFVHVSIDDDYYDESFDEQGSQPGESLGSHVGVALTDAIRSMLPIQLLMDRDRIDEVMDEVMSPMRFSVAATALVHLRVGGDVESLVSSPEPIARAFGVCRTVSLEAVGESESSWRLYLSGCADENASALRETMSHLGGIDPLLGAYEEMDTPMVAVLSGLLENVDMAKTPEHRAFARRFADHRDLFPDHAEALARGLMLILTAGESQDSSEVDERLDEEVAAFVRSTPSFWDAAAKLEAIGYQVLLDGAASEVAVPPSALSLDRPALKLYAAFGYPMSPGWAPIPMIEFGQVAGDVGLPLVVGDIAGDVVERITATIHNHPTVAAQINAEQQRSDVYLDAEESTRPFARLDLAQDLTSVLESAITDMTGPLVRSANSFLESVLPDAPYMQAVETDLLQILRGTWLRWEAFDTPSMRWVPVHELSDAQRRWANVALDFGDRFDSPNGAFLVIDEPERALHRGAIGQLATRLPELSMNRGVPTLVATHAPEFINSPEAEVHHVTRSADPFGRARAIPMVSAVRTEIASATDALGLTAADLLQLTRVFVLVEGEHDKVVIEALLDDVLREQHARTIAIRGVDSLTTLLDSEILLPYTSARLVIVFDHISDPRALRAAWDEARNVAQRNPTAAVKVFGGAVAELQRAAKPTKEDAAAINLAFGLLKTGYAARVDLFGFMKPGIEKYLPIREFVDDPAATWEDLDGEYMALPLGKRERESEKDWLRRSHEISITTETVRAAVGSMDGGDISDEFNDLARVIRRSGKPAAD